MKNVDLKISLPREGFTEQNLTNLYEMVASKALLLKKALGAKDLTIIVDQDTVSFPWFALDEKYPQAAEGYSQFITALCNTAKARRHIKAKHQDLFENEKFTMRIWLISLGLVGDDYKLCRKLLMQNLGGNAAFRYPKEVANDKK
jgi:hypothetical protein